MQQRDVNARQLEVLQWIAGGCREDVMEDSSYKTTAVALRNRGLADVSKRGGWHAIITEVGAYYLEHGHYPETTPKPPNPVRPKPQKQPSATLAPASSPAKKEPSELEPTPDVETAKRSARTVPVPKSLRKPHVIVQEMRDGKKPIPTTKAVQPRALRIVQAIATAAEQEGWRAQSTGRSRTQWGSEWDRKDLFVINTGECQIGIRLIQENDRTPHVPTAYELKRKERYDYTRIPDYDYVPSTRLRLELAGWGAHGRTYRWADRKRWVLEDKLGQVIDEIATRHGEAMQERLEKEAREAERQRVYEVALEQAMVLYREKHRAQELMRQADAWTRTQSFTQYLDAMESRIATLEPMDRPAALDWLGWCRQFVEQMNPIHGVPCMPEDPEMTVDALAEFVPSWARRGYRDW